MGYYTKFDLEISGTGERWVTGVDAKGEKIKVNIGIDKDEVTRELVNLSGYEHLFDGDTHKWYDYDENMLEISRKYPDLLFILSGEGEESGDLWRNYYKNGKSQRCNAVITYGEFDPVLLK